MLAVATFVLGGCAAADTSLLGSVPSEALAPMPGSDDAAGAGVVDFGSPDPVQERRDARYY